MPKTSYSPIKDFLDLKHITGLPNNRFTIVEGAYSKQIKEAQERLLDIFHGSYQFYTFDSIISQLNQLPPLSLAYASCYISLDYFYNRIQIPRKIYSSFSEKSEEMKSKEVEYYLHRFLAAFNNNSKELILCYLIFRANPDQKKIDSFLKKPILDELSKTSYLIKPEITELSINSINSKKWLIKQNLYSWERIKDKLDKGKPWPVRLINSNLGHPTNYYPFIAYNYSMNKDSIKLYVQDTSTAELLFWEFPITEAVLKPLNKEQTENLNGVIFDDYLHELPQLNFWNKVTYFTKLGAIFWWLSKFLNFFLRKRTQKNGL